MNECVSTWACGMFCIAVACRSCSLSIANAERQGANWCSSRAKLELTTWLPTCDYSTHNTPKSTAASSILTRFAATVFHLQPTSPQNGTAYSPASTDT
jgi:hypothetical protein